MKTDGQRGNSFAKEFPSGLPFRKLVYDAKKRKLARGWVPRTPASRIMLKEFFQGAVCLPESPLRSLLAEQKK